MASPLDLLLADGVIEEVVSRLKSGKEADVFLVHHHGELVVAKVYKERSTRSFKNNASYKEGRQVRSSRTQRAIDRGSRFGQQAEEEAWKSAEADTLYKLHGQGLSVPTPKMFYEGVLLMEFVCDEHGDAAPRLIECELTAEQAAFVYQELRKAAVGLLCLDLIHGDLSPYNVLIAPRGPVVIDFPQVVGAAHNQQAEFFFRRDLETLRKHLAHFDPSLQGREGDAFEIWRAYARRELAPGFVPSDRAPASGQQRSGKRKRRRGGGGGRDGARPEGSGQSAQPGQSGRQGQPGQPGRQGQPARQGHPARQGEARGDGSRRGQPGPGGAGSPGTPRNPQHGAPGERSAARGPQGERGASGPGSGTPGSSHRRRPRRRY